MTREELYKQALETASDINEHLPKLKEISSKVSHVTEFGVRRGVSTIGLLSGQPKTLIGYDIDPFIYYDDYKKVQGETDFKFYQKNVLKIEIEETDFLFIDTYHDYKQLIQELTLHGNKVSKFIGFHDTFIFGYEGESNEKDSGLLKAITEFMDNNTEWSIIYHTDNNNGLTILGKL